MRSRRAIAGVAIAAGFAGVAAAVTATAAVVRRKRASARHESGRTEHHKAMSELVDEAGLDSFPASDPPSWTLGEKGLD